MVTENMHRKNHDPALKEFLLSKEENDRVTCQDLVLVLALSLGNDKKMKTTCMAFSCTNEISKNSKTTSKRCVLKDNVVNKN